VRSGARGMTGHRDQTEALAFVRPAGKSRHLAKTAVSCGTGGGVVVHGRGHAAPVMMHRRPPEDQDNHGYSDRPPKRHRTVPGGRYDAVASRQRRVATDPPTRAASERPPSDPDAQTRSPSQLLDRPRLRDRSAGSRGSGALPPGRRHPAAPAAPPADAARCWASRQARWPAAPASTPGGPHGPTGRPTDCRSRVRRRAAGRRADADQGVAQTLAAHGCLPRQCSVMAAGQ
jgi:hypothetical protein